ncbi:MAG: TlpA family protein disulfide reductase [Planctomycetes bacterium]|nr:TlpA family protein disulfide reductase [Planctomycetota bacterium]
MRFRLFTVLCLFSVLALSTSALAQMTGGKNKELKVGSVAPAISAEWVKGSFDPSLETPYIVEFWATWCAPCKKSIPHLTHLQREYELDGIQVIGISIDEEQEKVEPFVQKQGRKMDYTVGIDNNNASKRAWMEAANRKGIPVAFIVDHKGVIQFIGHPMDDKFENILKKVMTGRYDQTKQNQAKDSIDAAKKFRSLSSWSEAARAYENAIAIDQIIFADLYLELFEMYLVNKGDAFSAYALAQKIISERGSEDPELLTWLAKKIASDPDITKSNRKMDVAMQAATAALSFTERKDDPKYLSTIAMVHYNNDDLEQAIQWQRRAYQAARSKKKQSYKITLDRYRTQMSHASTSQ